MTHRELLLANITTAQAVLSVAQDRADDWTIPEGVRWANELRRLRDRLEIQRKRLIAMEYEHKRKADKPGKVGGAR